MVLILRKPAVFNLFLFLLSWGIFSTPDKKPISFRKTCRLHWYLFPQSTERNCVASIRESHSCLSLFRISHYIFLRGRQAKLLESSTKKYLITKRSSYATVEWFVRRETIDGLDGNGLLKTYALSMEDKMAAGAFGRARNCGCDTEWYIDNFHHMAIWMAIHLLTFI